MKHNRLAMHTERFGRGATGGLAVRPVYLSLKLCTAHRFSTIPQILYR